MYKEILTSIWLIVTSRKVASSLTLISDFGIAVPSPIPVPKPEHVTTRYYTLLHVTNRYYT